MKKNYLSVIMAILLMAPACFASETEEVPSETAGVFEQICERGVLRVGTAGDYQPMSYLDPETGTYVGFDAELAQDLASAMGVEIEYVETS